MVAVEIIERLQRALVTAQNDDLSEPRSEKRSRHIERTDSINYAIEFICRLQSEAAEAKRHLLAVYNIAARRTDIFDAAKAFLEETCVGHVASENDKKVCALCGVHIDSLRPDAASEDQADDH